VVVGENEALEIPMRIYNFTLTRHWGRERDLGALNVLSYNRETITVRGRGFVLRFSHAEIQELAADSTRAVEYYADRDARHEKPDQGSP
jgi:hypothetical protein